jgi:hypothetical protein
MKYCFLLPILITAVCSAADPVTVCELAAHPSEFNGRMAVTEGPILFGFEQFQLSTEGCDGSGDVQIWLEYGRGPRHQPTTWCCGDLTPSDPVRLLQDKAFKQFDRLLHSKKHLTAKIEGRFDTCAPERCFGHFGMAQSRIVIQSVLSVKTIR